MNKLYLPIAIVVIALLLVTNLKTCISNYEIKKNLEALKNDSSKVAKQIETEVKEITRKIDRDGVEHVIFKEKEGYISQEDFLKTKSGLVDSVKMLLGLKDKEIQEIIKIAGRVNIEKAKATFELDSLKRKSPIYRDKYVYIKYNVDTTDTTGTFDFQYNADIRVAKYWKQKWFLGAKTNYVDIWSADSRLKINSVDKLTVEQKPKYFGLRLQGVASYDLGTGFPSYGAGARVDLGRVSIQPSYLYYPNDKEWRTSLSANYDLIRF